MILLRTYMLYEFALNFMKYLSDFSLIISRVIEFLRIYEFHNWHAIRGGLMLPDSISEEKLKID